MGTLGVGSASGSQLGPSAPTFRASHCAPAARWFLTVLRAFLLWPTTSNKVVFISTLMVFLAPCWTFSRWVRCAAFSGCLTLGTLKSWLCGHCLSCIWRNLFHLWLLLLQFHCLICVSLSLSPSFHAPWNAGGGLDMWCPLSSLSIWPTSWLRNVWLHEKATVSYIPFSLLRSGTGISRLCPWYVGQAGQLTSCSPCLMSLYISSMWFQ